MANFLTRVGPTLRRAADLAIEKASLPISTSLLPASPFWRIREPYAGAWQRGDERESLGGLARPRVLMLVDRYGDELRGVERRRALAGIPVPEGPEPRRVTWEQLLVAADHLT